MASLLCCVALVVHEKEIEVADIVDEESLVARRHHVAGLLVVAVPNLQDSNRSARVYCLESSLACNRDLLVFQCALLFLCVSED